MFGVVLLPKESSGAEASSWPLTWQLVCCASVEQRRHVAFGFAGSASALGTSCFYFPFPLLFNLLFVFEFFASNHTPRLGSAPALPPLAPAARALGCTLQGERLQEEAHPPPPEAARGFNGVTCGSRGEASRSPTRQRPSQKHWARGGLPEGGDSG